MSQLGRNKQLIKVVLLTQVIVVALASLLFGLLQKELMAALSILAGGAVNIIVQTYASFRMLSGGRFKQSLTLLKNLLTAEIVKFVLAIALLTIVLVKADALTPLLVVIGFVLAQISASLSPLFFKRLYG